MLGRPIGPSEPSAPARDSWAQLIQSYEDSSARRKRFNRLESLREAVESPTGGNLIDFGNSDDSDSDELDPDQRVRLEISPISSSNSSLASSTLSLSTAGSAATVLEAQCGHLLGHSAEEELLEAGSNHSSSSSSGVSSSESSMRPRAMESPPNYEEDISNCLSELVSAVVASSDQLVRLDREQQLGRPTVSISVQCNLSNELPSARFEDPKSDCLSLEVHMVRELSVGRDEELTLVAKRARQWIASALERANRTGFREPSWSVRLVRNRANEPAAATGGAAIEWLQTRELAESGATNQNQFGAHRFAASSRRGGRRRAESNQIVECLIERELVIWILDGSHNSHNNNNTSPGNQATTTTTCCLGEPVASESQQRRSRAGAGARAKEHPEEDGFGRGRALNEPINGPTGGPGKRAAAGRDSDGEQSVPRGAITRGNLVGLDDCESLDGLVWLCPSQSEAAKVREFWYRLLGDHCSESAASRLSQSEAATATTTTREQVGADKLEVIESNASELRLAARSQQTAGGSMRAQSLPSDLLELGGKIAKGTAFEEGDEGSARQGGEQIGASQGSIGVTTAATSIDYLPTGGRQLDRAGRLSLEPAAEARRESRVDRNNNSSSNNNHDDEDDDGDCQRAQCADAVEGNLLHRAESCLDLVAGRAGGQLKKSASGLDLRAAEPQRQQQQQVAAVGRTSFYRSVASRVLSSGSSTIRSLRGEMIKLNANRQSLSISSRPSMVQLEGRSQVLVGEREPQVVVWPGRIGSREGSSSGGGDPSSAGDHPTRSATAPEGEEADRGGRWREQQVEQRPALAAPEVKPRTSILKKRPPAAPAASGPAEEPRDQQVSREANNRQAAPAAPAKTTREAAERDQLTSDKANSSAEPKSILKNSQAKAINEQFGSRSGRQITQQLAAGLAGKRISANGTAPVAAQAPLVARPEGRQQQQQQQSRDEEEEEAEEEEEEEGNPIRGRPSFRLSSATSSCGGGRPVPPDRGAVEAARRPLAARNSTTRRSVTCETLARPRPRPKSTHSLAVVDQSRPRDGQQVASSGPQDSSKTKKASKSADHGPDETVSVERERAFERLRQRASCYDITRLMSRNNLQSQLMRLRSGSVSNLAAASGSPSSDVRQRRPAKLLGKAADERGGKRTGDPTGVEKVPADRPLFDPRSLRRLPAGAVAALRRGDQAEPLLAGQSESRRKLAEGATSGEQAGGKTRKEADGESAASESTLRQSSDEEQEEVEVEGEDRAGSDDKEGPQKVATSLSKSGPFSLLRQSFNQKTLSSMLKFSSRASLRIRPSAADKTEVTSSGGGNNGGGGGDGFGVKTGPAKAKQPKQKLKDQQRQQKQAVDQTAMMLYNQQVQLIYQQQQQQYAMQGGHLLAQGGAAGAQFEQQLLLQRRHHQQRQQQQQQQQLAYMASHYMAQQMAAMRPMPPPMFLPPQASHPSLGPTVAMLSATAVQQHQQQPSRASKRSILKPPGQVIYAPPVQPSQQQLIPMSVNHHSSLNIVYSAAPPSINSNRQPQFEFLHPQQHSTATHQLASSSFQQNPSGRAEADQLAAGSRQSSLGASMRKTVKSILINRSALLSASSNNLDRINSKTDPQQHHQPNNETEPKLKSALKSSSARRDVMLNSEGSDGDGSSSDSTTINSSNDEHQLKAPKSALKKSSASSGHDSSSSSSSNFSSDSSSSLASNGSNFQRAVASRCSRKSLVPMRQDDSDLRASTRQVGPTGGRKNVTFSSKLTSIL